MFRLMGEDVPDEWPMRQEMAGPESLSALGRQRRRVQKGDEWCEVGGALIGYLTVVVVARGDVVDRPGIAQKYNGSEKDNVKN